MNDVKSDSDTARILPPPLDGVKILDLTRILSGPFATLLLVDLGATVWKVEHRNGDDTRKIPPVVSGESHYFMSVNRGKKSIVIDLSTERGRSLALELAAKADVVIENFRPGVADRLGIGYESVRKVNERIVYCSISGFGSTGAMRNGPAFDVAIQAFSGLMSITGEPGRRPVRAGIPIADLVAGMMGVIGILAALNQRDRTGIGQFVDVSMLDSMLGLLTYWAGRYFLTGEVPGPTGGEHPSLVPYGVFEASDGYLVIATLSEGYWPRLCRAIGRPELADHPDFADNARRVAHRAEVDSTVQAEISKFPVSFWISVFAEHDIPGAPILRVDEALNNEQVSARGLIHQIVHPTVGPMKAVGPVIAFGGSTSPEVTPAPLLGQQGEEILRGVLGLTDPEIRHLLDAGAIALPNQD
ncbi:MAG: CoA transferase [Acidimicrobiales bacterium]